MYIKNITYRSIVTHGVLVQETIVSQSSIPEAFPSPLPPFWITAALFFHNEHLEQDEPAELLFPLSYWRRSISDPRVCLGELKLLFFHLHGMSPTPIKLLSLSSEIVFRHEIKNTIKSH